MLSVCFSVCVQDNPNNLAQTIWPRTAWLSTVRCCPWIPAVDPTTSHSRAAPCSPYGQHLHEYTWTTPDQALLFHSYNTDVPIIWPSSTTFCMMDHDEVMNALEAWLNPTQEIKTFSHWQYPHSSY